MLSGVAATAGIPVTNATPPEYKSFHRIQAIEPEDLRGQDEWIEIWAIYVGQGDALLIRLPETLSYDLNGKRERIDILVDGGPGLALRTFLRALYPNTTRLEHVVLTHHDSDHVNGLTKLLADDRFGAERIYHNGLASWARGTKDFPASGQQPSSGRVFESDRALALVEADSKTLQTDYLIDGLVALQDASPSFTGAYADFADAILSKSSPVPVSHFGHVQRGNGFIEAAEGSRIGNEIGLAVLWPPTSQTRYRGWAYTINGNSVTFRLTYRDFSMLFTGDHNEDSEADLLAQLGHRRDELVSDVLKVPHHGSQHNAEAFFDAVSPVVGVASMGTLGFARWKHPAEEVISWMGGPHRIYHTLIHERRFKYDHMSSDTLRDVWLETSHVLIQTDGHWFRVVEVEDPRDIPSVRDTDRGDGTRWIRAKE